MLHQFLMVLAIDEINKITDEAGLPKFGHTYLYDDGGTGEKGLINLPPLE